MDQNSRRVAYRYLRSALERKSFDASEMSDEELKDMADFLASQVDGMDDESVAFASYVGTAVPGERQKVITKLFPKLLLSYRKRLIEWFEHALLKRANLGGGGTGIKKVEEGLADFVEAIPEALTGGRVIRLQEYLPDTEYFQADMLDRVANKILAVVREAALEAGVLRGGKVAKATGLSLVQAPSGAWYIPPSNDTYPIRETLKQTYRFRWNRDERRWEVPELTPQIRQDFMVPMAAPMDDVQPALKDWYFHTWLPSNINRFTKVFTDYAKSKQSSYSIVFQVSGEKVSVKFARQIDTAWEAVEELRYRYSNRHGREPWLEVMDRFVDLTRTTSPNQLTTIIDRINNLQHSNGLFMEHFPAQVQSWYDGFLNAKYSAPTADELAKFIPDRDLRNLMIELGRPFMKHRPQDWKWSPPPAYDKMTKELQGIDNAVNWRARGYLRYKKTLQVDRFDPEVQDGLEVLKRLHGRRGEMLSTEPETPQQYEMVQTDLAEWSKSYERAKANAEKALEAQRLREIRTPGYAEEWERKNFPQEFLEHYPWSVPGIPLVNLAPFLARPYIAGMASRVADRWLP